MSAEESAHPELRIDQLTGLRSILAPGRASRPDDFDAPERPGPRAAETCPFCEGREDRTPPEVDADRPDGPADSPGWTTRVVPNLYPALGSQGTGEDPDDPLGASRRPGPPSLFSRRPVAGAHEVIISGPQHVTSLSELPLAQLESTVAMWRRRLAAHRDAPYAHLIVNEGPQAGASLEHTHAQLYALPFVPAAVARERERHAAYYQQTQGSQLLGDLASEEVRRRERVVAVADDSLLLCPWASRSPFELRIVPRRPSPRFEDDDVGTEMIAAALRLLGERFGGSPQLNLWVRTSPQGAEQFCWHIDIVPRLTIKAGFELGTGVDINIYPPERAAADLRGGDRAVRV